MSSHKNESLFKNKYVFCQIKTTVVVGEAIAQNSSDDDPESSSQNGVDRHPRSDFGSRVVLLKIHLAVVRPAERSCEIVCLERFITLFC